MKREGSLLLAGALAAVVACAVALVGCSANAPKAGSRAVSPPPVDVPADPPAPSFRLPADVRPTAYRLELTIDPAAKQLTGTVSIDITVGTATRAIWLHAAPEVAITRARAAGADVRTVRKGDLVGLIGDQPVRKTTIELAFTAPIDHERSRGIYAEQEAGVDYAYTFFEATDARRAFPCFDEPGFKTPWTLVLHVKQEHVALGNTAIVSERDEGAVKRVEFAPTQPLPSYLVAFIVGPFEVIDGGVGGRAKTKIQFAIPKGRSAELAWAREVTPRVVAALEDYFDMAYPWGKLDVAVVPRYWGTMEHPGIVAMGQPLTLIRAERQTRERKQAYANILAHELAHYWFGDYVTMRWWDDSWLNESMATWLDMKIIEAIEPSWRYGDERPRFSQSALSVDETLSTAAIHRPVTSPEAIEAAFDNGIVYYKGASVVRMLEAFVGADKWRAAMRAYMAKHAWGNASAEDLYAVLREQLGQPVEIALRRFVEQPGAPRVTFEPKCDLGQLVLRQTRALPVGQTAPGNALWPVPVCFRYGDDKTSHERCTEVAAAEVSIPLETCPKWLVPNRDARGYYRSAIDVALVEHLLDGKSAIARRAKPTAAERIMIVIDLASAVSRGELGADRVSALTPRVIADADPKVAAWATTAAAFRLRAFDDELYALGSKWLVKTFGPSARALGWQRLPKDSDERHALRLDFVPIVARFDLESRLAADAEKLADRWLRERKGVADDIVDGVLEIAARRGTAARFDAYLAAAKASADRTEQARLLRALANFTDATLVQRAFAIVLGKELDLRDTISILYTLVYRRETRDLTLAFLEQHMAELLPRMRDDQAAGFMGAVAAAFCDPERRKRAADLLVERATKIGGAQAAVTRGLEKSDQCIAELARQRPALEAFFKKN